MDDSALTKAKASRSRAACDPCRLVKQKCDGPSMIPCRRCMLYSLPCTYAVGAASSQKKTAKVAAAAAAASSAATGAATSAVPFASGQPQLDTPTNNLLHDMAARLRSIESAISSLQLSGLSSGSSSSRHGTVGTLSHPSASPEDGPSPRGTGSDPGGEAGQGAAAKQTDMGETAVQAINDAVDLLHQVTSSIPGLAAFQSHEAGEGVSEAEQEQGRTSASNKYEDGLIERILQSEAWVRPDVLDRGVMTIDEVDKTFEIFFTRLAPWTPFFPSVAPTTRALPEPYTPLAVRARSPLLFHAILIATTYFLLPSPGERSKRVYLGLMGIVNELVAPVVISTSKSDLTTDTVRALLLFVMWKPVQHAHYLATSPSPTSSSAERHYKNNAFSSASLWLLETHLLRTLNVHSLAPHAFAAAVQRAAASNRPFDTAFLASDPAARLAIDDLRLWFWTLVVDAHGALTTGRAAQFVAGGAESALALRTSRALAGFNLQASDVRLAAFVELYEVVREGMHAPWACVDDGAGGAAGAGAGTWRPEWEAEMDEWNRRVDAWEDEWLERLKAAFVGGEEGKERDAIAWNVLGNKHMCKAVLNASVFHRWNRTRRLAPHGSPSPPISPPLATGVQTMFPAFNFGGGLTMTSLSPAEWRFIQVAISAIERLVFQFSVESRVLVPGKAYDGFRRVQWPPLDPETGLRRPLTVDSQVAEAMKTSHDPVSCIGLVYPLILLAKICNAGLSRCELTTLDRPDDPGNVPWVGSSPAPSPPTGSDQTTGGGMATAVPVRPRAVLRGRKLCVLLSLGAAFLDQVAPTPAHPAAVHAKTLRLIIKAGTWGQELDMATAQKQKEAYERGAWREGGVGPKGPADKATSQTSSAAQLLSAILAQVSPATPGSSVCGTAAAAVPATPCSCTARDSGPTESAPASTVASSAPLPSPPTLAGSMFHSFGQSAHSDAGFGALPAAPSSSAAGMFPASTCSSGSTTTSSALYPSPPLAPPQQQQMSYDFSTAPRPTSSQPQPQQHFLGVPTPTSFPAFQPFSPSAGSAAGVGGFGALEAGTGLGMEVDSEALGALDWSALEKQLGMESGSLSQGFAAGVVGEGGSPSLARTAPPGAADGSLDWMESL